MTTNDLTTTEWLPIGEEYHAEPYRDALERAVTELTWQEPVDGEIRGPMSPVLALGAVIREFELRRVVRFAIGGGLRYPDGPEMATYQLLGVEVQTRQAMQRIYFLDAAGITPLRIDTTPRAVPATV